MNNQSQWIKLEEAIKIIESAEKKGMISSRTREIIITELHFLLNPDKYHKA